MTQIVKENRALITNPILTQVTENIGTVSGVSVHHQLFGMSQANKEEQEGERNKFLSFSHQNRIRMSFSSSVDSKC